MTSKLFFQALTKFLAGLVLVGVLLFVPAGTFAYWQGWLFIALLFGPMLIAGVVLMLRQPELLRKRLDAKEKQGEQKWVVALSGLMFLSMFVVAGLNYRFQWCLLPNWAVYVASAVFLIGYAFYAEVLRENVWLSRTIEVQEPSSDVCRHADPIPRYAPGAGFPVVVSDYAALHPHHRQAHPQRGGCLRAGT